MKTNSERRQINGEWIKALRKALGFSQEVFAERVGVSRPSVARWELDTFRPSLLAARLLLEFADAHRDELGAFDGGQGSALTRLTVRNPQRSQRRDDHDSNKRKTSKRTMQKRRR